MTKQEIEKAANEYQERIYTDVYEEGSLAEQELQCLNDFKAGADFTNKYWQEKTRWRLLVTTPPKLPSNPSEERQVLVRHAKGGYDVKFLVKQSSIDYWLKEEFVFWKEIE